MRIIFKSYCSEFKNNNQQVLTTVITNIRINMLLKYKNSRR